jgi:mannose-1-phosphate guanylyltransferase
MFCWRADTFCHQVEVLQPGMAAAIADVVRDPGTIARIYPSLTKISVDYAIMAPVSHGLPPARTLAVGLDADWADVGGYPALAEYLGQSESGPTAGNAVDGLAIVQHATGNLILNRTGDHRLVALCGVDDVIVVEDQDVTLVCAMSQAESIKQLVDLAREAGERYV